MNNTINGRTPEEIKKGLECCSQNTYTCGEGCPYEIECQRMGRNNDVILDTLAYIQQLERERDELLQKNQQLERERDAAVERCVNADDVSAGYYHEIQQIESAQPKWISVEERLPEHGRFLVITKKEDFPIKVHTATYNEFGWWTYADFGEVTHWMPLPNSPKEG